MDPARSDETNLVTGGGRTLAQLKAEIMRRVENAIMPLGGIAAQDARDALDGVDSLNRDRWAESWSAVAQRHFERAQGLDGHDPAGARAAYWSAWRLHHFARWPTENSPMRLLARTRALEAFRHYARLLSPAIEVLRVPFEGEEIVAYLRVPRAPHPVPVVLAIAGLDSRKEDIAAHTDAYLERALAIVAVDMPGTGEAPIRAARPDSERMFHALIDHLHTRPDLDARRMIVQGRSFSGHWAAKLAYTQRHRLRGCVVHGGGIHLAFQRAWAEPALKTGEYLYDYFDARRGMLGAADAQALFSTLAGFSLLDQGLLEQPCAPMLVVNGWLDSQTTCEDVFLLMRHGDPKEAWVNPKGRHMGRSAQWPGSRIQQEILIPWMLRRLAD